MNFVGARPSLIVLVVLARRISIDSKGTFVKKLYESTIIENPQTRNVEELEH